jgi:hypothetical protein
MAACYHLKAATCTITCRRSSHSQPAAIRKSWEGILERRDFVKFSFASWTLSCLSAFASEGIQKFDFMNARTGYLNRIAKIRSYGTLPIIDIESSYNPLNIDLERFTRDMDSAGIALMCLSADQPGSLVNSGQRWSHDSLEAYRKFPTHFIPTGNGGNHPAWTMAPGNFIEDCEKYIVPHGYPMMGEFEFRHYPSPRQVQRGDMYRNVMIQINGPQGHRLFAFAEKIGVPFQIHYEIEDVLLDPLDTMLTQYPKAKVIWCHLAQVRYQDRSTRYSPELITTWLAKHPNLYIDTAFGDSLSTYQPSGERHARYWVQQSEWREIIRANPYRFLAALDIGGDRMGKISEWTRTLRDFLNTLPEGVREIVAYKAAWKLLFNEELS